MDVNEFRADLLEEVHLNATMMRRNLEILNKLRLKVLDPAGAISRLMVIVLMKWTTAWRLLSLHFLTVLI